MTPKLKWTLVILGIIVVLSWGAYFSKASVMSHYQKFIEDTIAKRTAEIIQTYDEQKKVLQEQIYNKQVEINKKNVQLAEKEKKIKESQERLLLLQKRNAELERQLAAILLPLTPEETKKRLKELGYEVCH